MQKWRVVFLLPPFSSPLVKLVIYVTKLTASLLFCDRDHVFLCKFCDLAHKNLPKKYIFTFVKNDQKYDV